ncbi:hypothetical protein FE251_03800 [Georgenia wutianyii]|uniref:Uncharacterized protein n=1 Tax=Georgenia wutianyii TaxID=2585135 RepID=A0ABX5VKC6_9MICO|nr:hypothetical protein FE251_03800 [Georgenia wutianyii]
MKLDVSGRHGAERIFNEVVSDNRERPCWRSREYLEKRLPDLEVTVLAADAAFEGSSEDQEILACLSLERDAIDRLLANVGRTILREGCHGERCTTNTDRSADRLIERVGELARLESEQLFVRGKRHQREAAASR